MYENVGYLANPNPTPHACIFKLIWETIKLKSVTASASATTLSINPLNEEMKIAIFRNPVNSILHFEYNGELKTKVFDFLGRQLINTKAKTIDMSAMPIGVYIIQTTDSTTNKKNSYKVIKK